MRIFKTLFLNEGQDLRVILQFDLQLFLIEPWPAYFPFSLRSLLFEVWFRGLGEIVSGKALSVRYSHVCAVFKQVLDS